MLRATVAGVLVVATGLLAGCSTYLSEFQYLPRPALVEIPLKLQPPAPQPTQLPAQPAGTQPAVMQPASLHEPSALTVLATVVGVRRARHHLSEAVDMRVRLENGPLPVKFDPSRIQLVTQSLVTLGPPTSYPPQPVSLAPGESTVVQVSFPLPTGTSDVTLDLTGLRLSVPLTINGKPVRAAMNFLRVNPYYLYDPDPSYDPYYGPYLYPYPTFYGRIDYHNRGRFRQ